MLSLVADQIRQEERQKGLEAGLQNGKKLIAKKMKTADVDIDAIVNFTELSREEIELL